MVKFNRFMLRLSLIIVIFIISAIIMLLIWDEDERVPFWYNGIVVSCSIIIPDLLFRKIFNNSSQ